MISGIYTIVNNIDGKIYVGESMDVKDRIRCHKKDLKTRKHANKHLQNSFDKYGLDSFSFELLEECDIIFLKSQENYWCNLLDSHNKNRGYNIKSTHPDGIQQHTKESREKLRISNLITYQKEEVKTRHRQSILDYYANNVSYWKNRIKSKNHIQNIQKAKTGFIKKISKPVIQIDKVNNEEIIYASIREASRLTGVDRSLISKAIKITTRSAGGYKWKLYE